LLDVIASGRGVAPASPMPDKYAQLKVLPELRDQGILTTQEFQAQKTKVLASV
jgi:hypothetical protein